ncbi:MAG TPA: hypothetical protein VFP91_14660 [Vicinamibacterales bacterium]|nr:hypothetical protein [Vicinamibacterales bacterium]
MKRVLTFCVVAIGLLLPRADAQTAPNAANAALRYWMAFAVMRDPPADKATADLLEHVAEGNEAWDEAKLGPIVDDNRQALAIMQRASTLAFCDWGLEYELGSRTPIAHLAKARTLGRLSVIAGRRLQAQGQASQAVDMWLAGVRFSRHIAEGGSLISALSGRRVMELSLRAMHRDDVLKALDASTKKRLELFLRALPEDGLDWSAAMRRDAQSFEVTLRQLQTAPDPKAYLAATLGGAPLPADFKMPTAAEIAVYHAYTDRVVLALALPLDQRSSKLREIEAGRAALHVLFRQYTPSALPLGNGWTEIAGRRQSLLEALTRS